MQAVIFDMDGVIVDTEPLWREAEREVFAGVGLDLTDADCERTMGMRTDEVVAFWHDRSPWAAPSPDEVEARITSRMLHLISERAGVMPGSEHALTTARTAGLRLGLASSSCPELIDEVLAKLGLEGTFATVCSATAEPLGKPHPGVFLTTARRLGVEPAGCVVIEDSLAGVQAAVAAGMRVIAVPPAHLFDEPGFRHADLKLQSLEDLTAGMLGASRRSQVSGFIEKLKKLIRKRDAAIRRPR